MRLRLVPFASLILLSQLGCSSEPAASTDAAVVDVGASDGAAADAGGETREEVLRRGRIAAAACAFCHQDFQGRFAGQTTPRPMSTQYGANLTPDPQTGIGMWSDDEIVRAVRAGVGRDGRTLCNLMTRYSTNMLTDQNLRAVITFLRAEAPVRQEIPRSTCP